jgi:hypothetical protein
MVFRIDPDHRSGTLEWLVVGVSVGVALISSAMAYCELRAATANS